MSHAVSDDICTYCGKSVTDPSTLTVHVFPFDIDQPCH